MNISVAQVPTTKGSRYLQQLCKHWAHKFTVEFTPTQGNIDFLDGRSCGLKATDDTLEVTAFSPLDDMAAFQNVIERHIQRFAHREGDLSFAWASADD